MTSSARPSSHRRVDQCGRSRHGRRRRCRGSVRRGSGSAASVASQRARSTFCWLPPDSSLIGMSGSAARMSSSLDEARRRSRPARREISGLEPGRAWPAAPARCFRARRDRRMMPSVLRSSGQIAEAMARRRRAGLQLDRLAVDRDAAAVGALGAEHQPRDFGAARAEQAGDADHLAACAASRSNGAT